MDDTALLAELETACEVIDRLELYRTCLEEALADAYDDLAALLALGPGPWRPL